MKRNYCALLALLVFFLFNNCRVKTGGSSPASLFVLHTSESTGIEFSNTLYETTELNIITFEYFNNGAGVAVGDINGDGLQDLYFSGNMVPGKLYLNKGNFKFEDITAKAGIDTQNKWGSGVSMADVNGDGLLDIYLCFAGPYDAQRRKKQLYINNGNLTFSEKAAEFGLDDDAYTTQAAFFDYDRDGDLDVYLLNNITDDLGPNIIRPKRIRGEMINTDRLYRNDGGRFTNVSVKAGILKEGYGLGVAIGDVNQDGWPDVYVSNDYLSNDLLWINNHDGTFTDRASEYFRHTSYSSMGCDMQDINNDAFPDIVAVDMLPPGHVRRKLMMGGINHNRYRSEIAAGYTPQYMRNTLQLHQGPGPDGRPVYSEIGQLAGISATDWSWSPLIADLDNDGWRDLLISNGYPRDITNMDFASFKASPDMRGKSDEAFIAQLVKNLKSVPPAYLPNYIFKNKGNLQFEDVSSEWGFTQPSFSHGAAVADLDNDGDLDYIANNSYDKVFVYENRAETLPNHHFLRIKLNDSNGNTGGLGAKVWVYCDSMVWFAEYSPFRGYQSTVEPFLHFGVGNHKRIDSIAVQWPLGDWQVIPEISADTVLLISRQGGMQRKDFVIHWGETMFKTWDQTPNFQHIDPYFDDFSILRLLPHKHSQEGPRIAVADVNGDGLDDFFIGGAFRQPGRLFVQQRNGSFSIKILDPGDSMEEDLGSVFFDADGDQDLDLYVCSGSSEFPLESPLYRDRLYRNDGKGNFSLSSDALPQFNTSTSCVAAADYDHDGDQDLFVGGRLTPEHYPESPRSYLLENRDGRFHDVTQAVAPGLSRIGMVTDALWSDVGGDGWPDLILAGEWMPLCVFRNEKGTFPGSLEQVSIPHTTGWWNRLAAADLDGDGDEDYIAGNLGLNTPYQIKGEHSLSLYYGDFDQNGRPDPFVVQNLNGKTAPVAYRDDVLSWVFPLRKKFTSYLSYANAEWNDFFPGVQAQQIEARLMSTVWVENQGSGSFLVHPLPIEAQLSPVYGIQIGDFNFDGKADLLLSGNSSAADPHVGNYDAFNGLLLTGMGNGSFLPVHFRESGFFVPGEGRDLKILRVAGNKKIILCSQNNGKLIGFEMRKPNRF